MRISIDLLRVFVITYAIEAAEFVAACNVQMTAFRIVRPVQRAQTGARP
jgi:hypothetical protein